MISIYLLFHKIFSAGIQTVMGENLIKHRPSYPYDRLNFANKTDVGRFITIGFIAANGN